MSADVTTIEWTRICAAERLLPDRGAAALIDGEQVAVFLLTSGETYVIHNHDPFSQADVLSRGIVGDVDGTPTVASPVYKQRFDLRTGRCVDDPDVQLRTWPVRVAEGWVQVGA